MACASVGLDAWAAAGLPVEPVPGRADDFRWPRTAVRIEPVEPLQPPPSDSAGDVPAGADALAASGIAAPAQQTSFGLTGRVSGVRVVILGGGLAGMTVAYELGKVGYDCRVLEARARPGGRCFTVRRGTVSEEDGPPQTAALDDGLYLNAGPMRIPYHHQTTLGYCRELQVPTEVFVPDCESAYLYRTSGPLAGRHVRLREARADFDGYIAELLSKALSQAQLDQPMTNDDRERLLAYLRRLGALDQQRHYRGSRRRGGHGRNP